MKNLNWKKQYQVSEVISLWLSTNREIKIQSYQRYERIINNYIIKYLGDVLLSNLSLEDIHRFFDLQSQLGVAISTQKTMLYMLRASLEYAYSHGYCEYIDLKEIKLKVIPDTIYVFSKEEQMILERQLREKMNIRKLCMLLCLYTGVRIGEICGLKWEDIDFNRGSLTIKRTIERIKNINYDYERKTLLIESTPKSMTSNRVIPVPDFLIEYLEEFKTRDSYFCCQAIEKLYDPRLFESFYKRLIKKCNIPIVKFHTLRHTFATRSIESKMDIKTLSEILGHSSVEITLKLYVHPSYELKKASIENLVKFMVNS